MKEYIITVMARDRVGIVRDVSSALTRLEGNITNVSQTVMRGYFTLIMSVEMPDERTILEIRQGVERSGEVGELEVNVRPFVEVPEVAPALPSERFTLSLRGKDQKGIICNVTGHLADKGVNIDDFYAFVLDSKFIYLFQISIPQGANIEELHQELERIGKEFDVTVHFQHENIFRATSEIRPIIELQYD